MELIQPKMLIPILLCLMAIHISLLDASGSESFLIPKEELESKAPKPLLHSSSVEPASEDDKKNKDDTRIQISKEEPTPHNGIFPNL